MKLCKHCECFIIFIIKIKYMKFTQEKPIEILTNNPVVNVIMHKALFLLFNPNSVKICKRDKSKYYKGQSFLPDLQTDPLGTG